MRALVLTIVACLCVQGWAADALTKAPDAGYVPESTPFDNPSNALLTPVPIIPSAPDCGVRPQTVVEIQRMRDSASRIAQMIESEVTVMARRKQYVEQMTVYLNDRIRELNKVKGELAEEIKWISVSQARIQELSEREKLVKMQDVLTCLNGDKDRMAIEEQTQSSSISQMQAASSSVQQRIDEIKSRITAASSSSMSVGQSSSSGSRRSKGGEQQEEQEQQQEVQLEEPAQVEEEQQEEDQEAK
jgi:hypothetical protein